ncbi:hypothetical protein CISIN_1g044685mg [Citrus sinensis]|uniref:Uncharacterized protein n=1 Tax=Citrus sinensis TaxID=2711 RepID=A0A067D604_CITSI|nr:hypothetical protein CISIN_1g044685mg [Citrus sinensis]
MIGPQPLIFGHAAQFITVNDYRFHPSVNGWLERGLHCHPCFSLSLHLSLSHSLSPLMCELPQMHLQNRRLIGRTPLWGMMYS